jgi:serine/threonine protein kinase
MTTPESVTAEESGLPIGSKRRTPEGERRRRKTPASDSVPPRSDPEFTTPSSIVGSHIGKYQVLRKLGEGGMGAVFEAMHRDIGQRAAIKILHPHLSKEQKFIQRFIDEARLVSMVGHPGLVKVYDYTRTTEGTLCIIMEFLEGESLWHRFERIRDKNSDGVPGRKAGMAVIEVLQIARQVASALAAVHARGIVHRDLKPDNIMLVKDPDTPSGERAKILDFGIAKLDQAEGGTRNTTTGVSLGTPTYMAPEQIEGQGAPTDRIDVYAFGVILFELLAGEAPFVSESTGGILRQHLIKEPPPLPSHVPVEIQALVRKALAKEAAERPTMAQIVEQIDQLAGELHTAGGGLARLSNSTIPVRHFESIKASAAAARRTRIILGTVAACSLGLLVSGWIWMHNQTPPPPPKHTIPAVTPPQPTVPSQMAGTERPAKPSPGTSAPENPAQPPIAVEPPQPSKKLPGKGEGKKGGGKKERRFGDLPSRPAGK